jgi:hypothetical protein
MLQDSGLSTLTLPDHSWKICTERSSRQSRSRTKLKILLRLLYQMVHLHLLLRQSRAESTVLATNVFEYHCVGVGVEFFGRCSSTSCFGVTALHLRGANACFRGSISLHLEFVIFAWARVHVRNSVTCGTAKLNRGSS